jgi:hypothetical protein
VSKVIWELALLPTIEVEVLPDGKSPILLGVLLPEVEEAGIVEKRFVGSDIDGNTEGKIMTKKSTGQNEVPVKTKKKSEKLDSRTSRILGGPLESPSQNPRIRRQKRGIKGYCVRFSSHPKNNYSARLLF